MPPKKKTATSVVAAQHIEGSIQLIRGQKVMLDMDLARLYNTPVSALNQAVSRNLDRFPDDFMFRLDKDEWESLKSQFVTSNEGRGGRRWAPRAFTEQGVAMLSSVLRSERAVAVNIEIMRAFVRLRRILATNEELAKKLASLDRKYEKHDAQLKAVFDVIRDLMTPPEKERRPIGFVAPSSKPKQTKKPRKKT